MLRNFLLMAAVATTIAIVGCSTEELAGPTANTAPDTGSMAAGDSLCPCTVIVNEYIPVPGDSTTDTVYLPGSTVTDTVLLSEVTTDTVFVPDSFLVGNFCDVLEKSTKQLAWKLQPGSGTHRLNFSALTDSDQPPQSVLIKIGADRYDWAVATEKEMVLERPATATGEWVIITAHVPPAAGHGIHICLEIRRE